MQTMNCCDRRALSTNVPWGEKRSYDSRRLSGFHQRVSTALCPFCEPDEFDNTIVEKLEELMLQKCFEDRMQVNPERMMSPMKAKAQQEVSL